jgi:hypothetical protein
MGRDPVAREEHFPRGFGEGGFIGVKKGKGTQAMKE